MRYYDTFLTRRLMIYTGISGFLMYLLTSANDIPPLASRIPALLDPLVVIVGACLSIAGLAFGFLRLIQLEKVLDLHAKARLEALKNEQDKLKKRRARFYCLLYPSVVLIHPLSGLLIAKAIPELFSIHLAHAIVGTGMYLLFVYQELGIRKERLTSLKKITDEWKDLTLWERDFLGDLYDQYATEEYKKQSEEYHRKLEEFFSPEGQKKLLTKIRTYSATLGRAHATTLTPDRFSMAEIEDCLRELHTLEEGVEQEILTEHKRIADPLIAQLTIELDKKRAALN